MKKGESAPRRGLYALAGLSCVAVCAASLCLPTPATAATVLIVPPTSAPNSNIIPGFNDLARSRYVEPFYPAFSRSCGELAENCVGINYPATFWPTSGGPDADTWNVSVGIGLQNLNDVLLLELATTPADEPINLFGYSQGARVVSLSMQNLVDALPSDLRDRMSAVVAGNISRPNGGVWARLSELPTVPVFDITFGDPTPTDVFDDCTDNRAECRVTDISFQYDGVSDFPLYLSNVLAVANALAGFISSPHPTYLGPAFGELPGGYTDAELAEQMNESLHPENFAYFGDTRYITIPSRELPIVRVILDSTPPALQPLVRPLMELIEPVLRWRIDKAYDRAVNPGETTPIRLFRIPFVDYDPLQEAGEFFAALGEGIARVTGGGSAAGNVVPAATAVAAAPRPDQNRRVTETPASEPAAGPDGAGQTTRDTGDGPTRIAAVTDTADRARATITTDRTDTHPAPRSTASATSQSAAAASPNRLENANEASRHRRVPADRPSPPRTRNA